MAAILKTSEDWQAEFVDVLVIFDMAGWREDKDNFKYIWREMKISKEDFLERANKSMVFLKAGWREKIGSVAKRQKRAPAKR